MTLSISQLKKKEIMKAKVLQSEDSIKAATDIYNGHILINEISRKDRLTTNLIIEKTPVGLNPNQAERKIRQIVSNSMTIKLPLVRKEYSVDERRDLLRKRSFDTHNEHPMSYWEDFFGVPEATSRRDLKALKTSLDQNGSKSVAFKEYAQNNQQIVETAIENLEFKLSGPQKILSTVDRDLLAHKFDWRGKSGYGLSQSQMREETLDFVGSLQDDEDITEKERMRLINFKASPGWLRNNYNYFDKSTYSYETDPKTTKHSNQSFRRAEAAQPKRSQEMVNKFRLKIDELRVEHELPPDWPTEEDICNYDEVGVADDGKCHRIFSLDPGFGTRRFNLQQGERSDVQATVGITTIANGQLLPFNITHKGGGCKSTLRGDLISNLHDDFTIHCTESGYNDRDGQRLVLKSIMDFMKPSTSLKNIKLLFIDGHDSHFDLISLETAHESGMITFFLKSNDSINDQPNDNGINALFKSKLGSQLSSFKSKYVGIKLSPFHLNKVLSTTYMKLLEASNLEETIRKSYRITGIFPLMSANEMLHLESADLEIQKMISKTQGASTISDIFAGNTDFLHTRQDREDSMDYRETTVVDNPANAATSFITYKFVRPGDPNYALLIKNTAYEMHMASHVIPARKLREVLIEEKAAKGVRVDKPAKNCLNPVTTTGAVYGADMRQHLQEKIELNRTRMASAETRKKGKCDSEFNKKVARIQTTKEMLAKYPDDQWQCEKNVVLSAAWMVLVKPLLSTQDSITVPTKKADLILALVPAIKAQRDTGIDLLIENIEMEGQQDQEGQDDSDSESE